MTSPEHVSDLAAVPDAPASFTLYEAPGIDQLDPRFDEGLMQHAAAHGPSACIWQAAQGLVVPRTYLRSPVFHEVCRDFDAQGWPVSVRHSGGGVVPQGPGILNVSLAYAIEGRPLDHSDSAYQLLCDLMSTAIARFGISAQARAVEGSFCDGRFNLATGDATDPRKIAGTAQLWRRLPHPDHGLVQVVLVHALLLVACDINNVTDQANRLEEALGHSRRYLPERAASLHTLTTLTVHDADAWVEDVHHALRDALITLPPAIAI